MGEKLTSISSSPLSMSSFSVLTAVFFPLFRLKPLDIEFMKQLHHLVNIIPVIAKSDTLTPREIKALKMKVIPLLLCTP